MKKVLVISAMIIVPAFCEGATSMMGGAGLFKLPTARTSERGLFSVGLSGEYAQDSYPRVVQGDSLEDKHHYMEGRFTLTYGVLDHLESYLRLDAFGEYDEQVDKTGERPDFYSGGMGGFELGFKTSRWMYARAESSIAVIAGARGHLDFANFGSPSGTREMMARGFAPYVGHNPDLGVDLSSDIEVKPLAIHGLIGYLGAGKANEREFSRKSELHWGIGGEVQFGPYVAVACELLGEKLIDKPQSVPDTAWFAPGIRFYNPTGVVFDFALELGVTSFDFVPDDRTEGAKWNAVFGLTATSQLIKKRPEPLVAEISGKVLDRDNGEPLGATVTVSGLAQPVFSDPETGFYKLYLAESDAKITVTREGYRWQERYVQVKGQRNMLLDFHLARKPLGDGFLTGVTRDVNSQIPIKAQVMLTDTTGFGSESDARTGIYKLIAPPGTHTVKVTAQNYRETVLPVVVEAEKGVIQDFSLRPVEVLTKGKRIVLKGIIFASGSTKLEPSSFYSLNEALETLKMNSNARVEIAGHTDSEGAASANKKLSLVRARAVRDWLMGAGIAADRLVAKGYGESMPVASNKNEEGRAQNRRIEFIVLSQ